MNTPVDKLLELDSKAKRMVDEAQQYYDDTIRDIEREKKSLRLQYDDNAFSHIEQVQHVEESFTAERIESIRQQFEQLSKQLDSLYEAEHQGWIDHLSSRCIGGDA